MSRGEAGGASGEFGRVVCGFEEPWPWWECLPSDYTVKRKWHEIVKFHEALKYELAYDPFMGCRRVKAKVPVLPDPGDLDAWLRSYAATGDACAMARKTSEIVGKETSGSFDELGDLHWMYCHNRLAPYFDAVNKVLEELPTKVIASSRAIRRFVTGGVSGRRPPSNLPIPPRFLGRLIPTIPEKQDLARAARAFRQSKSTGALPGTKSEGAAPAAAAKLVLAKK